MKPRGRRRTVRRAGTPILSITLAVTAVLSPRVLAAAGAGEPLPAGEPRQVSCGEPATASAPAMVACDSGGEGATSCETKRTISVGGFGSVSGCGISCTNGWYACCQDATITQRASCTCEPDQPRRPWTPESPW